MKLKAATQIEQAEFGAQPNQIMPVVPISPALDVTSAATAINPPSDLKQMAVLLAKQFFTVRDCATITALSEKTILRLLKRGKLRCITSIRHKRIPATELARFIREDLG